LIYYFFLKNKMAQKENITCRVTTPDRYFQLCNAHLGCSMADVDRGAPGEVECQ
jgi:hypothetical protein